MSQTQPKRRPPMRAGSDVQAPLAPPAPPAPPVPLAHSPHPRPPEARNQLPPTGSDAFPYVIAALVGLIIVGLAVAAFLIGSITSQPQAASLPSHAKPDSSSPTNSTAPQSVKSATANPPARSDSLPGVAVPSEGQAHVQEGQAITYQSYPPSSGTHYASTADYGFSETEIPEGKLVHNLEHGAIVLYYKPNLPIAVLKSLRDTVAKLPTEKHGEVKIVIAPYPKLQTAMSIAAWGRVESLEGFDYQKIVTFYEAMVDHGPEDVP